MKKLKSMPLAVAIAVMLVGMCYSCNKEKYSFNKNCEENNETGFQIVFKDPSYNTSVNIFRRELPNITLVKSYHFTGNKKLDGHYFFAENDVKTIVSLYTYSYVGTDTTPLSRRDIILGDQSFSTCNIEILSIF